MLLLSIALALLALFAMWKLKAFPFGLALTADRDTHERDGKMFVHPVAAAKKIFAGALVVLDSSGNAEPGATATGKIAVGRAEHLADNTLGDAGDVQVKVASGVFKFANSSAGDAITKAEIGDACYIVDDQTVAKTSGTGTRSIAGYIMAVDDDGVWVKVGPIMSLSGGLVASNNLSDVGTAATARANLGVNKFPLTLRATNLKGADATRYLVVSPVAGTISKIYSVLEGAALATGNATLTGKINGTAITNGAITITQAGSAIGDVDVATPTALNVVDVGDVIELLVGGTNTDTNAFADVTIVITI